jgi:hypothetical protein
MIRRAAAHDISEIVALRSATIPKLLNRDVRFSPGTFAEKVRRFVQPSNPDLECFVSEASGRVVAVVLCYAMVHPDIGEKVGAEASWLADPKFPGHGRAVLKRAEEWYRERGAKRVFAACNDDRTQRLLELLGYHQTERVFEKLLCPSSSA